MNVAQYNKTLLERNGTKNCPTKSFSSILVLTQPLLNLSWPHRIGEKFFIRSCKSERFKADGEDSYDQLITILFLCFNDRCTSGFI